MDQTDGPAVTACTRCPALVGSRSQIVNGTGPEDASLVFVGEAPGKNEDSQGEPFVGRSGSVLDDELAANGVAREDVRITNCVRCRPPDNRDPHVEELSSCTGWLAHELAVLEPELLVTLGKVPGEHVLERSLAVTNESGTRETIELGDRSYDVMVCLHPAATLYDRSQEELFGATIESALNHAGLLE